MLILHLLGRARPAENYEECFLETCVGLQGGSLRAWSFFCVNGGYIDNKMETTVMDYIGNIRYNIL